VLFGGVAGGFCLGGAQKNEVKHASDYINANKPYGVLIINFFKTTGRLKKISGF
jgi:hypothetical protein